MPQTTEPGSTENIYTFLAVLLDKNTSWNQSQMGQSKATSKNKQAVQDIFHENQRCPFNVN